MKPAQGTLGIVRHNVDNYCQQPVGISWKIGQGTASFCLWKSLQWDLFGDAGGKQQGQGRYGERYGPFLHLSRGHGKPFQIIELITCGADPMTAM